MDVMTRALLLACLALCVAFGVSRCQYKDLETYTAEYKAEIYKQIVEVNQRARQEEQAKQQQVNKLGQEYEDKLQTIKNGYATELAAAIKSGDVKLRNHWKTYCPVSTVPGSAGSASPTEDADELRAKDIGYLRELGAIADAREKAYISYAATCVATNLPQK